MIKVRYSSLDRFRETRTFKTLAGARRFAKKWVGNHPEIGSDYAVSADGIGKITVTGATLSDLFSEPRPLPPASIRGESFYNESYERWGDGS